KGNTYARRGDARRAIPYYEKALALARTDEDTALWLRNLASAYVNTGNLEAAQVNNQRAASLAPGPGSKARILENAAAITAGQQQYGKACELYREAIQAAPGNPEVLWQSHAGLAETYTQMGEHIGANREFMETLEVIDNNVARLSTADYKLTFFSRLISFYQNYVHALVGRQAFTQALEVADSSRARILFERLSIEGKPARRSGGDYRAIAKSSGSVILFYWLAPKASYLWVVTPERIHPPVELPPADQIQRWVNEYRAFVEQRAGDPMA